MKKNSLYKYILLVILPVFMAATNFDELDKVPDGAYKGQMFFSTTFGMGIPYGDVIDAESEFLNNVTYTFEDSLVTKEMLVGHLSFQGSLDFEYMPADYVGVKVSAAYNSVVQRTLFGSEYKNENEFLYSNYGFYTGPDFHFTKRKQWDVRLYPFVGYGYGAFNAAPAMKNLFSAFTADTEASGGAIIYGADLSAVYYFKGGFFISVGFNWINYKVKIPENIQRTSPSPSATYFDGSTEGTVSETNLLFSAGYAYYN